MIKIEFYKQINEGLLLHFVKLFGLKHDCDGTLSEGLYFTQPKAFLHFSDYYLNDESHGHRGFGHNPIYLNIAETSFC